MTVDRVLPRNANTIIRCRVRAHPLHEDAMAPIKSELSDTNKEELLMLCDTLSMKIPSRTQCARYAQLKARDKLTTAMAMQVVNFEARQRGDDVALLDLPESQFASEQDVMKVVLATRKDIESKAESAARKANRTAVTMTPAMSTPQVEQVQPAPVVAASAVMGSTYDDADLERIVGSLGPYETVTITAAGFERKEFTPVGT